jgi:integrase
LGNLPAAAVLLEEKIQKVFALAQDPELGGKPFTYPDSTPHCLRHTFAIQMLISGRDIKQVSRWLGHRSISTTEKYLRVIRSLMIKDQREGKESNDRKEEQLNRIRHAKRTAIV